MISIFYVFVLNINNLIMNMLSTNLSILLIFMYKQHIEKIQFYHLLKLKSFNARTGLQLSHVVL